ncbi:MAG: thermonuclease family protein [Oxalobacteraceae bacterium]|nr:thermonuclease family protein [Oxalobacteraceae bacterium]
MMQRLLLCAAVTALSTLAQGAELVGKVVAIADGDTITLLDAYSRQHKVRLQGIDAPERGQAYWKASKQHLADGVYLRQVVVEYDKKDRYGRIVGHVRHEGRDMNLEQLQAGAAWFYRKYAKELSADVRANYAVAEIAASRDRRGLWREEQPVAPWDWRARGRAMQQKGN